MKQLNEYIHLYIGCEAIHVPDDGTTCKIIGVTGDTIHIFNNDHHQQGCTDQDGIQPILRRLEDMTEDEAKEIGWWDDWENRIAYAKDFKEDWMFSSSSMLCLLSKSFDLFALIDAGLAIDRKTL